jgi:UDP-N-acetylglucosamine 2-epimerase (non-hydrolysing)
MTLRANTERPATITDGTNRLVGNDAAALERAVEDVLAGRWRSGRRPERWDGHAAERIVDIIASGITSSSPRG